jgi:hypothetical protein
MKEDRDSYCGFSCGNVLDQVRDICNEVKAFSEYNPEYSLVMLGKIMEIAYETRQGLLRMKRKEEQKIEAD